MAKVVTGEQYVGIDGKLHDIKRQLRLRGGYPHDPEHLNRALQAIVEGRFEAVSDESTASMDDLLQGRLVIADFVSRIFEGWKILEHTKQTLEAINDLEVVCFLENEKSVHAVSGEEMKRRAVIIGATLGFLDAVFSLERQAGIPEERKQLYIVFPGTVLVNPDNSERIVACLRPMNGRLIFVWRQLSVAWWEHDRLARVKVAA